MSFSTFDIVLIVIVAGFILSGIRFGLIHTLGSLIGVAVGAFVATHYGTQIATWLAKIIHFDITQMGKWVTFFIIFFIVARLVGFIFWIAEKMLDIITKLPFISSVNHVLGGVLGFFEGALVVGLSLYYGRQLPVEQITKLIDASKLSGYFISISKVLLPLVPEALKQVPKIF